MPDGVAGSKVNPDAVKFYNNVFDELKKAGIEPAVTLYHWDLPQVSSVTFSLVGGVSSGKPMQLQLSTFDGALSG